MKAGDYVTALLDLALPRTCAVCGRKLNWKERHLCIWCTADFPSTFFWDRKVHPMADQLNDHISRDLLQEGARYEPYSYAVALFFYNSETGYKNIPQLLKYCRSFSIGRHYAHHLSRALSSAPWFQDIDLVVPVPLHWMRWWKRGYNQAAVIAETIARDLAVPCAPHLLVRGRNTSTQTRLSVEDKQTNVSHAFRINRRRARRLHPSPAHILIVDDVFTTGATICACHRALRAYFGPDTRISAATLAYVGNG